LREKKKVLDSLPIKMRWANRGLRNAGENKFEKKGEKKEGISI